MVMVWRDLNVNKTYLNKMSSGDENFPNFFVVYKFEINQGCSKEFMNFSREVLYYGRK